MAVKLKLDVLSFVFCWCLVWRIYPHCGVWLLISGLEYLTLQPAFLRVAPASAWLSGCNDVDSLCSSTWSPNLPPCGADSKPSLPWLVLYAGLLPASL